MSESTQRPVGAAKPEVRRDGLRKWTPRFCNLLLWLLLCAMAGTGLQIAYRLPPGSRGGRGLSSLGWTRHEWGDLHQWISIAFLALIVVHMVLHWRWFWQIACRKRAWPLLTGVLAGIILLLGILTLPVKRAEKPAATDAHHTKVGASEGPTDPGGGKRFRGGRSEHHGTD